MAPWLLLLKLYCSAFLVFMSVVFDGVFMRIHVIIKRLHLRRFRYFSLLTILSLGRLIITNIMRPYSALFTAFRKIKWRSGRVKMKWRSERVKMKWRSGRVSLISRKPHPCTWCSIRNRVKLSSFRATGLCAHLSTRTTHTHTHTQTHARTRTHTHTYTHTHTQTHSQTHTHNHTPNR